MKISFTNSLIFMSLVFTILAIINPETQKLWINWYFLYQKDYVNFFFQIIISSFIHNWFMHFFWNSLFLFLFWNSLEIKLWLKKYVWFFIMSLFITICALVWFNPYITTVWISYFCMAILAYMVWIYKFELKTDDYKWWLVWIIILIIIWYWTNISLVWHLFGALSWFLFYFLNRFFDEKNTN